LVFGIDIETCSACGGGVVRIVAYIENPDVVEKILVYRDVQVIDRPPKRPRCRAPSLRVALNALMWVFRLS